MRARLLLILIAVASTAGAAEVVLTPVATGLDLPVAIAHAGDSRLFVVLQRGRIMVIESGAVRSQPFLDVTSLVSCCGERGLLGVAFHPRFTENRLFYVNYTNTAGNTVVARYTVSAGDPNRADASTAKTILTVAQPFANHNGGHLAFGPDGYLYIGTGDGGSAGDPGNRAQNTNDLLGKMLRIDVDGGDPYAIPSSNPFVGTAGVRPEIWAYGLRNPWKYSFDRVTGDLWIADVGQGSWEEVDFQEASSRGGENYGWRIMEGSHCFNPPNCSSSGLVLPVIEYDHSDGSCSVTGGHRYRGARSIGLYGTYVYGDYCSGWIRGLTRLPNGTWSSTQLAATGLRISTFGEGFDGELYVAGYGSNGTVYRISDAAPLPARRRSVRK